ncbi:MAG: competence/damage-inducible protein A [Clostridia bacterium]|nr:competence/damage-inducible protein A [Clostridia bacterium]
MNAEIIAVGTELLLGDILNTNAQFLSRELSGLGIDVYYQQVVGDNPARMKQVIGEAISRSDLVILSGGLGPTDDDLTKETVADYFGLPLYFDESVMEEMTAYLKGRKLSVSNRKQAYIPEGAIVIHNNYGTAPGIIIEKDEKIVVMLPGPPRELEPLFCEQVRPYLRAKSDFVMKSKVLRLFGIGESTLGEEVRDLMESANPTLAPYAKDNEVTLRITAKAESEEEADHLICDMKEKVTARVGAHIYGEDEEELYAVVCRMLKERGMTIAAAESCTAGLFSATIANWPGASEILHEGVVTYANRAKEKYLGVSSQTLQSVGAVSPETAQEMAEGIRKASGADIGVGITGIAGPGGGTPEKPVGLVYIGVAHEGRTEVLERNLHGTRKKVREASVMNALFAVRKILEKRS